jgi:hypothetical protein
MRWLRQWFRTSLSARSILRRHRPTRRLLLEQLEDRTLLAVTVSGLPRWEAQGPGPINDGGFIDVGAIQAVAVDPGDPDNVYIGAINGGVWHTTNATDPSPHWDAQTDMAPSLSIGALAFSPLDSQTLYAGTANIDNGRATGLLRTIDGGEHWKQVGDGQLDGHSIRSVVPTASFFRLPDGTVEQTVLVATNDAGVWRSTDSGETFTPLPTGGARQLAIGTQTDLVADPVLGGPLYAAVTGYGVYRTDDFGSHWDLLTGNTPNFSTSGLADIRLASFNQGGLDGVYALAQAPVTYCGGDNTNATVYRYTNQNASWQAMDTNYPKVLDPDCPETYGLVHQNDAYHLSIGVDPTNPNVVFIAAYTATIGIVYRGNIRQPFGKDWELVSPSGAQGTTHADSRHMTFAPDKTLPGVYDLLEADDGGLYRLVNPDDPSSRRWESVNGDLQITELHNAAYDSLNHVVFSGAQDNGNPAQSAPGNLLWTNQDGGDGGTLAIDTSGPNAIRYLMTGGSNIKYLHRRVFNPSNTQITDSSYNHGSDLVPLASPGTPDVVYSGLRNADTNPDHDINGTFALNASPFAKARMLVGTYDTAMGGLYESFNGGQTLFDLTGNFSFLPAVNVSTFAYGGGENGSFNADVIYVSLYYNVTVGGHPHLNNVLFLRDGPGGEFKQLTYPGSTTLDSKITHIVLDPANWRTAYVSESNNRIYRTTTAGDSWEDITGNLGALTTTIQTIEVVNLSGVPGKEVVFVGGDSGFYRTLDPADADPHWRRYGSNLPHTIGEDLHYYDKVHDNADVLVAGSYGRGAWIVTNASSTLTEPATLQVTGDDNGVADDTIVLRLDPADLSVVQVILNGQIQYEGPYDVLDGININGGGGHDTIDIEDIPVGVAVTVNDAQTVNVGRAGTMIGIQGTLTVSSNGVTDLTVDDHLDLLPRDLTIDASSIRCSDWGGIFYGANDLNSLTIDGGLAILPFGSPNGNVFTITDTPSNPYLSLVTTVYSHSDKDIINVQATTGPLVVYGGSLVNFGDASHNLNHLGPVTVNGSGKTAVHVDDSGNLLTSIDASVYAPVSTQYVVAAQQLTRSTLLVKLAGPPFDPPVLSLSSTINYSGLAGLTITGGPLGAYGYQVNSTAGANSITIDAASSADSVTVGDPSHPLTTLNVLTVHGNGNTTLTVDDSGNLPSVIGASVYQPVSTQYVVSSQQATRSALLVKVAGPPFDPPVLSLSSTVNYSGLASLSIAGGRMGAYGFVVGSTIGTKALAISGGAASNSFSLQGTNSGTSTIINAGSQANLINIGSVANSLDPIQGAITVNGPGGSTALTINDQGSSAAHTYTLMDNSLSRTGAAVINYHTPGNLTVNGGGGGNTFQLRTTTAGPAMTLDSGAGPDMFVFADQAVVPGVLDGQGGFDTLDYRAYTTPANVDLGTGTATGVSGGVRNIENVLGATVSITVANTADSGPGSLRQAIFAANAHPGHDTITFAIAGSGVHVISPASPLPDITDPVAIDGYSQPGASPNTMAVGDNAVLLIQLDGSNAGLGANGLHITAGSSMVQGLLIDNFARTPAPSYLGGNAILVDTNGGNVIQGNILGTHDAGVYPVFSNGNYDVMVDLGSSNNLIGGTTPAARNVLSGAGSGVGLFGGATNNLVQGNYVGTDATGTHAVPNFDGISDGGHGTTIGGTAPGAGNVISGNVRIGIYGGLGGATQGNFIGTDASGTALLSNGSFGIFAPNAELIGGTVPRARNVITGLSGISIFLWIGPGNVVQGNYIGTDVTGSAPLGDPGDGIAIQSSNNNVIGGVGPGAGNVIANCFQVNVYLLLGSTGNVVEGNHIGTNAAGTAGLGVNGVGVLIDTGSRNNTIGGTTLGAGNCIAFNSAAGIAVVDAASTGNSIRGNSIHDNGGLGIDLGNDGVTGNGSSPRTGPNNLQNYPTILAAGPVGTSTGVAGTLNALPSTTFTVDFYSSPVADPSGHGQGQRYLGSTTVTTDSMGNGAFSLLMPAVGAGDVITATATDPSGNTSEFSTAAVLQPLAVLAIDVHGALSYTASAGIANNLTLMLAGSSYSFHDTGEKILILGPGSTGWAGAGTNTVQGPSASLSAVSVDVGDQNNSVIVQALGTTPLTLKAGAGSNTLQGPDVGNSWQITGADTGTLDGQSFSSFGTLHGGASTDVFAFHSGASLSGSLDGGGGTNTLDYSQYTGDITVDLPLNLASLVNQQAAGSVFNIANVTGSNGNGLLVGDANANVLRGGTGRSVIIGGAGADQVFGGGGDNILIGGTTSYDANLTALAAIMAEFTRTDLNFHQRVNDLMLGGGLNGTYVLNADPTQGPVTMFDDSAPDVLAGGGGASWFVYHKANDTINNRQAGDKVTQV